MNTIVFVMTYRILVRFLFMMGLLLTFGCSHEKQNTRLISVFFDPSYALSIENYHFLATLNGKVLLDSMIANTHINSSLLIGCTNIDTTQKNVLKLSVQHLSKEINLNEYHTKCIEVFSHYDDKTRIRKKFYAYEAYLIRHTSVSPDYKKYIDSVKATGTLKSYDSLSVSIQTDKCWCNPKADHHENKGVVPGMISIN